MLALFLAVQLAQWERRACWWCTATAELVEVSGIGGKADRVEMRVRQRCRPADRAL